jgi:RNA polymerase sigma-70 factor (ECF subfamily)
MTAFDEIFKKYHQPLYTYARKFLDDDYAALDLVQDVFALVWQKKMFRLEEGHLKAYLFNAVKNAAINYLKHEKVVQKHQKRQLSLLLDLEITHYESGEKSMIEKENLDRIYQAIGSLSDIHREVIELSRFEGLKNKEIAQQLNIPVRTVETRLFRALSSLKEKLSEKVFHILLNFCALKKS